MRARTDVDAVTIDALGTLVRLRDPVPALGEALRRAGEWKNAAVSWRTYEEAAAFLLNSFAEEFGIDWVEGKQHVTGNRSGTEYEIDAKGVRVADGGFMLVECRRYTTSRQSQEKVGALAYRILGATEWNGASALLLEPIRVEAAR